MSPVCQYCRPLLCASRSTLPHAYLGFLAQAAESVHSTVEAMGDELAARDCNGPNSLNNHAFILRRRVCLKKCTILLANSLSGQGRKG